MRTLLLLPLLLTCISLGQNPSVPEEVSSVVVLNFKYFKSRQVIKQQGSATIPPAVDMIEASRINQRKPKPQPMAGVRDPNTETTDARSAALEKNVQDARSPESTLVGGYTYHVKIRNAHTQNIEVVFWEYQFKEVSNPTNIVRRQFLCGVKIKPDKESDLRAFSVLGPPDVVSVDSLSNRYEKLVEEKVVINRVEYADGTIFQRKGWKFSEMKSSIERAIKTPWGPEMCRSL